MKRIGSTFNDLPWDEALNTMTRSFLAALLLLGLWAVHSQTTATANIQEDMGFTMGEFVVWWIVLTVIQQAFQMFTLSRDEYGSILSDSFFYLGGRVVAIFLFTCLAGICFSILVPIVWYASLHAPNYLQQSQIIFSFLACGAYGSYLFWKTSRVIMDHRLGAINRTDVTLYLGIALLVLILLTLWDSELNRLYKAYRPINLNNIGMMLLLVSPFLNGNRKVLEQIYTMAGTVAIVIIAAFTWQIVDIFSPDLTMWSWHAVMLYPLVMGVVIGLRSTFIPLYHSRPGLLHPLMAWLIRIGEKRDAELEQW